MLFRSDALLQLLILLLQLLPVRTLEGLQAHVQNGLGLKMCIRDRLWELDRMEFHIPETGRTVKANHRPVVIITSNAEKELPDAFLRRCVFHYIEFPDKELMADIVRVHFPDLDEKLLTQVLEAFYKIRSLPQIKKKPSTSEIIDWIQALQHGGVAVDRIVKEVPYLGVLLKKNEDIDTLRRSWK